MAFITATEYAERNGITTQTVRNRIAAGTLNGKKMGNTIMVEVDALSPAEPQTPSAPQVFAVNTNALSPDTVKTISRYNDTGEMTTNEIVVSMHEQIQSIEEFLLSPEYTAFKKWQKTQEDGTCDDKS